MDLDLRGMKCPKPILVLNDAVKNMASGEQFTAVANDKAFELDVHAWCRRTGHELISIAKDDAELQATIRTK